MKPAAALLLLLLAAPPAAAVEPSEMLSDPALEARAREISRGIRCLVCQNENIDDSGAELAADLRRLVRERVKAGDSDQQVRDFLVARYGDYVLMRPPVRPSTWPLWFGSGAALFVAAGALVLFVRRRGAVNVTAAPALAADEERRLREIMERKG